MLEVHVQPSTKTSTILRAFSCFSSVSPAKSPDITLKQATIALFPIHTLLSSSLSPSMLLTQSLNEPHIYIYIYINSDKNLNGNMTCVNHGNETVKSGGRATRGEEDKILASEKDRRSGRLVIGRPRTRASLTTKQHHTDLVGDADI